MLSEYEFETPSPQLSYCDCCGGMTVRLTRFVCRDGGACAVYYGVYSNNHTDNMLAMIISIGDFGEGSDPGGRAAFLCHVHPTKDSYEVMLGDAAESQWGDASILGAKLSRESALIHPDKATAFAILDAAFLHDPVLRGFLGRAHCGTPAVPLEWNYGSPDDIFALNDQSALRVKRSRSFASLDDQRFFVRALLDVPIEHYGTWAVGLWVEIAKTDYDHISKVWNEAALYSHMRFLGRIANSLEAKIGIALPAGSAVAPRRVVRFGCANCVACPAMDEACIRAVRCRAWISLAECTYRRCSACSAGSAAGGLFNYSGGSTFFPPVGSVRLIKVHIESPSLPLAGGMSVIGRCGPMSGGW
jgi:hypothetical protein